MREKLMYALAAIAALLLVRNLYEMFIGSARRGVAGRDLPDHVFPCSGSVDVHDRRVRRRWSRVSCIWSRKDFAADSLAASVTEVAPGIRRRESADRNDLGADHLGHLVGMGCAADLHVDLVPDVRRISDAAQAIDEPTQRARMSAVLSILTFPAVVIT